MKIMSAKRIAGLIGLGLLLGGLAGGWLGYGRFRLRTELQGRSQPRQPGKIDGSTSTIPLVIRLLQKLPEVEGAWNLCRQQKSVNFLVNAGNLDPDEMAALIRSLWTNSGTHESYLRLINRECEIILVAREPSDGELATARTKGVGLSVQAMALDALVFLVNKKLPVKGLTGKEIVDIYTGRIRDWTKIAEFASTLQTSDPQIRAELEQKLGRGRPEYDITVYKREPTSGSQVLMDRLVMKAESIDQKLAQLAFGMGGPYEVLYMEPRGLAFSVYYYAVNMAKNRHVRLLAVDGIEPTPATIAARRYPYTSPVYVVVRQESKPDAFISGLVDWLLSPAGQAEVVAATGYVPLDAANKRYDAPDGPANLSSN